jgi:hypothetical protein
MPKAKTGMGITNGSHTLEEDNPGAAGRCKRNVSKNGGEGWEEGFSPLLFPHEFSQESEGNTEKHNKINQIN